MKGFAPVSLSVGCPRPPPAEQASPPPQASLRDGPKRLLFVQAVLDAVLGPVIILFKKYILY